LLPSSLVVVSCTGRISPTGRATGLVADLPFPGRSRFSGGYAIGLGILRETDL
jgi:hypothetical protein